jgi:hypothetical protein
VPASNAAALELSRAAGWTGNLPGVLNTPSNTPCCVQLYELPFPSMLSCRSKFVNWLFEMQCNDQSGTINASIKISAHAQKGQAAAPGSVGGRPAHQAQYDTVVAPADKLLITRGRDTLSCKRAKLGFRLGKFQENENERGEGEEWDCGHAGTLKLFGSRCNCERGACARACAQLVPGVPPHSAVAVHK